MLKQKILRLSVRPVPGETIREFQFRRGEFNNKKPFRRASPETLLAQLLKRQGRRIMADVSACPADTVPAHLARLDDWREIACHVIENELAQTPESRLSGCQLLHPSTVADYIAAAELTRRTHRSPAFANAGDEIAENVLHRLDLLAGLILRDAELTHFLTSEERGAE
jgi:hypothetical protein